ncbi:MAG: cobyrinate a,c-diamide synthase [Alphaproteobacteria bacterium]|jgi:cobyrinic acid a,c-diamide synthase|nr:cobyrinate a,c-diamide synthase [Alphaproteobacteria bacterium]
MPPPGLIVSAPASGAGKTTVTLGLLAALGAAGAKLGPDYIDPGFHRAASGRPSRNLDPWAMRPSLLASLVNETGADADLIIAEGAMGLFDGAEHPGARGHGGTAELARATGWPVVLVVPADGMAQSVGALVQGFARFDPMVSIAGVILNRVASPRHERLLRSGLGEMPVFGAIPRDAALALPSRHLGLVQAEEAPDLAAFVAHAAQVARDHCDLAAIRAAARPTILARPDPPVALPPLGQRIAVASDVAFRFAYPHLLDGWRRAGAEILPFSPLADEVPQGDAVYLPGGYPELHAGRLAASSRFLAGLARMPVAYGECGGYMVLGHGLVDADGTRHRMAGLLPVETSFARRRLHLGYRLAKSVATTPFGPAGTLFRAHEFHYASVVAGDGVDPAFIVDGTAVGARAGGVFGSFLHLIDMA